MRFNIKQLLMLFVLLGLVGGLLTIVIQPRHPRFGGMDFDGGSKIALTSANSVVLVDLQQRRFGKHKKLGQQSKGSWGFASPAVDVQALDVKFLDSDRILVVRENMSGFRELVYFSIPKNKVEKQIVLSTWDWSKHYISIGESLIIADIPTVSVQQQIQNVSSKPSFVIYETASGKRIKLPDEFNLNNSKSVAASDDGNTIGIVRETNGETETEFWDRESGTQLASLKIPATGIKFLPDNNSAILYDGRTVTLFDIVNQRKKWESVVGIDVDPRMIEFNRSGTRVAFGKSKFGSVEVVAINCDDGEILNNHSVKATTNGLPDHRMRFIDETRIAVSPMSSDHGLPILDTNTGRQQVIGGFFRLATALLFAGLFIFWCWAWGQLALRERRIHEQDQGRDQTSDASISADHPIGSITQSPPQVANPEQETAMLDSDSEIITADIVVAEIVETANLSWSPTISFDHKMCWRLMMIGGIFAIGWSVIPMFYFRYAGMTSDFLEMFFYIRMVVALFGLIVGVLAATRGFGRYRSLMTLTASLQILNLVGLDVLNGIFGIVTLMVIDRKDRLEPVKLLQTGYLSSNRNHR